MLVLRSSAASPFVRKARIAAALLGLDDRIEISDADTSNPEDSLRTQNPLGKIPALVLESGDVIFDSAVIVEYLDWLAGGGKIIPSEPRARFRTLTRQALADGISEAAVLMRYELVWREPDKRSEKWMAYQGDKIARSRRRRPSSGATSARSRSPRRSATSTCASRALGGRSVRGWWPGSTISRERPRASKRRVLGGEGAGGKSPAAGAASGADALKPRNSNRQPRQPFLPRERADKTHRLPFRTPSP
jgi:hypothetical protein